MTPGRISLIAALLVTAWYLWDLPTTQTLQPESFDAYFSVAIVLFFVTWIIAVAICYVVRAAFRERELHPFE